CGTAHQFIQGRLGHAEAFGSCGGGIYRLPGVRARGFRAPIGVRPYEGSWLSKELMPNIESRARRKACVAGRRMDVDLFEWRLLENVSVCHAIESNAARQADLLQPGAGRKLTKHAQIDFFQPSLECCCEISVLLLDRLVGSAGSTAEFLRQAAREHV